MKLDIDFHRIDLPVELMQICGVSVACVYAVLRAASENEIANISRNEISNRTGLKITAIKDALKKLEALGIVERHYNPGYATSYLVKDILPAEQPEPENVRAAEPARQSEQKPEQGLKSGYQYYGKYEIVSLLPKTYNSLCSTYSKTSIDDYIHRIELHCKAYGKTYPDYAAVIENWLEKDIRKAAPNDVIKQQEMREIGKYIEERKDELDKYLDLIN